MFVLPTGGGKTIVFASLLHRRPGRALILAHRDELIQQAADKLAQVTGDRLSIGMVKRSRTTPVPAGWSPRCGLFQAGPP